MKEGVYLDWNTYMGVNSRVADYKTVSMDESAALNYIDIYQADMNHPHIELLEMLGI